MGRPALVVVAKRPVPGQTKTRLCPPLTPSQAASLYECFLRDTLEIVRHVPEAQPVIGYLPEDAAGYFRGLAPDMELALQRGDSLGERLDHLLTAALASGADKAIVMDSDSPTLPARYIRRAFAELETTDVVLGPTRDGGYYLIGVKQPQPRLLRHVHMSTPHVLAETLELAKSEGLSVALLPGWYDVDTIGDLHQLVGDIVESLEQSCGVATRAWIARSEWRAVAA